MKAWTPQDRSKAIQWRNHGRPPEFIAHRLGRPVAEIESLLQIMKKSAGKPMKSPRKCLGCGKDFMSTGPGNRICPRCTTENARTSPLGAVMGTGCSQAGRGYR